MQTNILLAMKTADHNESSVTTIWNAIPRGFALSQQMHLDDEFVFLFMGWWEGDVQTLADIVEIELNGRDALYSKFAVSQFPNKISRKSIRVL